MGDKTILHGLSQNIGYGYRNHPKFSDRQALANSADPDQTAPFGQFLSLFEF